MKIAANTQESQARVERLLPQTSLAVANVLERAMAGQELSREDGIVLAHSAAPARAGRPLPAPAGAPRR